MVDKELLSRKLSFLQNYVSELNTTATYLQKVVLIVKDVFSYEICRPHNFFEYGNELFPKLALC